MAEAPDDQFAEWAVDLAESIERVRRVLVLHEPVLARQVIRLLNRVLFHLERRLQVLLGGPLVIDSEQMALAMIKGTAAELHQAANALDAAAYVLRERGAGREASQTKQAATKARTAAEGLVNG